MTEQPDALRLAQILTGPDGLASWHREDAAAELRRLHEAHDWQYKMAGDRLRRIEKLERVNAQLLEALEYWLPDATMVGTPHIGEWQRHTAAIAAAKGEA